MKQIIYQLLPRLWGKGKFSSIDRKSLDYWKSLGTDYLWYTGVIRHATHSTAGGFAPSKVVKGDAGSPYAIIDYYDVNPYLADDPAHRMDEFLQLVQRTHQAGMKVIIDFVPNHVARENVNFGQEDNTSVHWAAENDFYYYPGQELRLPVACPGYKEFPAKASGNAFTPSPGKNDWYETIRLNYCDFHTHTWDKMLDVVRFWAGKGVDGFRCDMVEMVPPAFMKWLIASIKDQYPDLLFVAEVYEEEKYRMYAEEVGFDLLYDKTGLYDSVRAITCQGLSARLLTWNWQFLGNLQPRMLNFLENHDEQRVASDFFCGSAANGYAALAVSLLLNTAPFMLYFGQEAGERGMQAEGFSGLDGRTSIFDWCSVPAFSHPDQSVLARYRELLTLSRQAPFASGKTFDLCYCQDASFDADRLFAWLRSDGQQTWLLCANFGPKADITLRIPPEAIDYLKIKAHQTAFSLTVPEKDYAILPVE